MTLDLHCPICGYSIGDKDSFCTECGESLDSLHTKIEPEKPERPSIKYQGNSEVSLRCPNCRMDISSADSVCPHCGTKLDAPLTTTEFQALAQPYFENAQADIDAQTKIAARRQWLEDNKPLINLIVACLLFAVEMLAANFFGDFNYPYYRDLPKTQLYYTILNIVCLAILSLFNVYAVPALVEWFQSAERSVGTRLAVVGGIFFSFFCGPIVGIGIGAAFALFLALTLVHAYARLQIEKTAQIYTEAQVHQDTSLFARTPAYTEPWLQRMKEEMKGKITICPYCGERMEDVPRYCRNCGEKIDFVEPVDKDQV